MRIWGVHIGEETAVIARRGVNAHTVDRVETLPLDGLLPRETAIKKLVTELKSMHLFEMEDHIHLSFFSQEMYTFVTDMDRSIPNVDETLAWELDLRVEGGAQNYAFSVAKINNHRYLCSGMPQKKLAKITKLFTQLGVEVSSVDVPIIASLQALDINGYMGRSYFYLEGGLHHCTAVVIVDGTIKMLQTLFYDAPVSAVKELLSNLKHEYPEVQEYALGGEAFATAESVKQFLAEHPGGRISNPFQKITYIGELPVETSPTLLYSAIGLSQKAV